MAVALNEVFKFVPGQVIAKANPFIYCISHNKRDKFCAACFKADHLADETSKINLKECADCHEFKYCGPECQANDWKKFHKFDCKLFSQNASKLQDDFSRVALRFALLHEKRPEDFTRKFKLIDGKERSFEDLEEHSDETKKNELRVASFVKAFSLLRSLGVTFDERILFKTLSKFCINSFSILDPSLGEIGSAVYIETSIFNHSCQPNAAAIFNGSSIVVRALKRIRSNEEVTINYIDIKQTRKERQSQLQSRYFFTCRCARCVKEEKQGENFSLHDEIVALDSQFDKLVSPPSHNPSDVPWLECYKLLIKTLPLYEAVYGEYHPDFTVQLMRCLKVRSMIDFVDGTDSLKFLVNKLQRAIEVTHGKEHPLYDQFKNLFQL